MVEPIVWLYDYDYIVYNVDDSKNKFKSRGDRSFAAAAPKLWNKLPVQVRRSQDIGTFKSRLKTHLFTTAFNQ